MRRLALILLLARAPARTRTASTCGVKDGESLGADRGRVLRRSQVREFHRVDSKLTAGKPVRPGEWLRVPVSSEIVTSPGYVRDAGRHATSATPSATLARRAQRPVGGRDAGGRDDVPGAVRRDVHAPGNESLAKIAAHLSRRREARAELLRALQLPRRRRAREGRADHGPALHVRLQPAKQKPLDDKAKARRELQRDRREARARSRSRGRVRRGGLATSRR